MWLFEIDRKASWLLRCEDFEWKWDPPCIRLIVAQLLTRKQQNSLFVVSSARQNYLKQRLCVLYGSEIIYGVELGQKHKVGGWMVRENERNLWSAMFEGCSFLR